MQLNKPSVLVASIFLISAIAAGCQNGGVSDKQTAGATAGAGSQTQAPGNKPAELVFYSTSADSPESFDQRYGNPIRKKFPNYTIKYIQNKPGTKFEELMTSGQPIDIYWDSIGAFSSNVIGYGLNYDMTNLAQKSGLDVSRFDNVPLDAVKSFSGGGLFGIPVSNTNLVLYYNKDLFDKFGIAYPKDGMTWDEVNGLARRLNRNQDGVMYTGLSISPKHLLRMNNFSEPFVDASGKKQALDTDNWKKALDAYFAAPGADPVMKQRTKELKRAPYNDEFFKDKTSAMYAFLSNQPVVIPEKFRLMNWDMVSFPTFKEQPGVGSQAYPFYFGITAQSKEKEAAMEVLKFLTSDEYQMEYSKKGIMSVLNNKSIKDAYGTETEFKDHNLKAVFYNKFAPIQRKSVYDEAIITLIDKEAPNMIAGEADMNTLIRSLGENAQKQIDSLMSKK